jgi:tRNA dimethylallyltransferase
MGRMQQLPTLVIVGATATGKSELAAAVASRLGGEVVNADALQLYRGLDLGTGKPDERLREAVPHHLFDLLAPGERASAGWYARAAGPVIAEIRARGRRPVVVGGTGFYLEALFDGLAEIPPVPRELQVELARRLVRHGSRVLARELALLDPAWSARVATGDTQRLLRGLAVALGTGRRLTDWHRQPRVPVVPGPTKWFGLTLPRAELRQRIEQRVAAMLAAGWRNEVAALLAAGVAADAPAFQAIGYRDVVEDLAAPTTQPPLGERIVRATCQYAKRQETWFRRRRDVWWLDARAPLAERVAAVVAAACELDAGGQVRGAGIAHDGGRGDVGGGGPA